MSPATKELLDHLVATLAPVLITVLTAGVAWLGKSLNSYVSSKTTGERYQQTLTRLSEIVSTVVLEIRQTEVDAIKAATSDDSPGGRRITVEEAKHLSGKAHDKAKLYLGDVGIKDVMNVLGFGSNFRQFDDYLSSRIEATIQTLKTPPVQAQPLTRDTLRPPTILPLYPPSVRR